MRPRSAVPVWPCQDRDPEQIVSRSRICLRIPGQLIFITGPTVRTADTGPSHYMISFTKASNARLPTKVEGRGFRTHGRRDWISCVDGVKAIDLSSADTHEHWCPRNQSSNKLDDRDEAWIPASAGIVGEDEEGSPPITSMCHPVCNAERSFALRARAPVRVTQRNPVCNASVLFVLMSLSAHIECAQGCSLFFPR